MGDCEQIEQVAGAMRVELVKRRGASIGVAEHGGDRSKFPTEKLAPKDVLRNHKARALAREPEKVDDYVRETIKAGNVPSVRGAHSA